MVTQADEENGLERLLAAYTLAPGAGRGLAVLLDRLAADDRAPTAVRERREVLDRHIGDSLVALELPAVRRARAAADLGSGAGLPGLVLACALPAARFALVESQRSKCDYIASLAGEMGVANARVVCARAEAWPEGLEAHDLVTARALAPQPVVLEYAAPLLAPGGMLVDWRGARSAEEERAAGRAAESLGLQCVEVRRVKPFPGARNRHLHSFEKVAATPPRFPRRPGIARKRPLGV